MADEISNISDDRTEIENDDDQKTNMTCVQIIAFLIGALILLGIVGAVIYIAFFDKIDISAYSSEQLIFSTVIFNSGEHSPDYLDNDSLFPRGPGQLTDKGFENSYKLGELLHDRYVKTQFINPILITKEMRWESMKNDKCLETASTVSAGMMNSENIQKYAPVISIDELRSHNTFCLNITSQNCNSNQNDIIKCLGIHNKISEKYTIEEINEFVDKNRIGLDIPGEMNSNSKEIIEIYSKVNNYKLGIGEYRNDQVLRIKFGNVLYRILKNFETFTPSKSNSKFVAFSVDDDIFSGLYEILKSKDSSSPKIPGFNSMILIELFKTGNDEKYIRIELTTNDDVSITTNDGLDQFLKKYEHFTKENQTTCEK